MDKNNNIVETALNHNIQITDRKAMLITGVKKLESFDSKEFFIESVMGYILIKGEELELLKLDTFQGTLSIKGKLFFLSYVDEGSKKAKGESVLAKLFK
jgi:sporulation protein YabP